MVGSAGVGVNPGISYGGHESQSIAGAGAPAARYGVTTGRSIGGNRLVRANSRYQ